MENPGINETNGASYSWFEPVANHETEFEQKVRELKLVLDGLRGLYADTSNDTPNVDSSPWGMREGYRSQ